METYDQGDTMPDVATTVVRRFDLRYTNPAERSDKVYAGQVEQVDGGYTVTCFNGKYGGTMTPRPQTTRPVDLAAANRLLEKQYAKKISEGYCDMIAGGAIRVTAPTDPALAAALERLPSRMQPTESTREEMEAMIAHPDYVLSEKMDGDGCMIDIVGSRMVAVSRTRKAMALPDRVAAVLASFPAGQYSLDGEMIGDTYYAFDALEIAGYALRESPFIDRHGMLEDLLAPFDPSGAVRLVPIAMTLDAKRALRARCEAEGREGVIARQFRASYTPGKAPSGGVIRKFKFRERLSARVAAGREGRRSIGYELQDDTGAWRHMGHVTVPANQAIPTDGYVEIEYLYAHGSIAAPGALFQPTLIGPRHDVEDTDCRLAQVKFKPAT